ncbi:MAG: hypothetical protein GY847_05595, partial [Proteobacteria bacterium]|nr:hypothetical protein [Pseudomonadota bacterium]
MKRKILAFGLIALLLLGAMAYLYLFRTEVANNPKIGIMTYYYSWGMPARIALDSNRDGKTDFLGEIEAPFGAVGSHTAELIEYWEDRDHDGHFELHVFVDNADPFS